MTEPALWSPEPLLAGQTIFLLAGGPSLRDFDCTRLRGRNVMAINSSCHMVEAAGIERPWLYFTDHTWFLNHRDVVERWPGPVIAGDRRIKAALPDKVRLIQRKDAPDFSIGSPTVRGRSSGHVAISLAISMRARRAILLGYDMRFVDGRSHHHDEYAAKAPEVYREDFLPGFTGWDDAAERHGTEVLNATPGSALREFPCVALDDVLPADPGREFWTPEALWIGAEVHILGGGPSLAAVDLATLRGKRVIVINSSCHAALAAGLTDAVLFFTDPEWFDAHRDTIRSWPAPVVTLSRRAKAEMPDRLLLVQSEIMPGFPKPGTSPIKQGVSSGHTAIGLAVALGATRVVLHGYDCRLVDGRSHHHDDYRSEADGYADFIQGFTGWDAAARAAGVEIVNASPGSAVREFPQCKPR